MDYAAENNPPRSLVHKEKYIFHTFKALYDCIDDSERKIL